MTPREWDDMLRQTAQDRKLGANERAALAQRLGAVTDQQAAAFRARAFDVFRAEELTPNQRELLGWLEDIVKLLHPVRPAATSADALFTPDDDVPTRIAGLFRNAKASADVCVFTITDDRIADAMLDSHRRGVKLRVITDDEKAFDLGADVARLQAAGVPLATDRSPAHMHHKFALFDRAVLLNGSYNWTRSAQSANRENVVITGERRLVERFGTYFDRQWTLLGGER